jgi:hypothetical protein
MGYSVAGVCSSAAASLTTRRVFTRADSLDRRDAVPKLWSKINEGILMPKCATEFLARNEFSPLPEQRNQKQERLALELDPDASLPEVRRREDGFRKRRNVSIARLTGIPARWFSQQAIYPWRAFGRTASQTGPACLSSLDNRVAAKLADS